MLCRFRRFGKEEVNEIDLKRHFKHNLKASTAIRYGKYGASRLTVEMSVKNIDDMFEGFRRNQLSKFNGSSNFE